MGKKAGKRDRSVRLADVAQLAKLSTATVSRYLNDPDLLKPDTADRIRMAIEETGYIRNALAGSLASQRSHLVALLIPHISSTLFAATIEEMIAEFASASVVVMVGVTQLDREREVDLYHAALSRQADAIITTGSIPQNLRNILKSSRTTTVEIWDLPEDCIGFAVGFDHFKVGQAIARFAHARGYERPHIIYADGPRASKRRKGFLTAWSELSDQSLTESEVKAPSQFGDARRCFAQLRRIAPQPDIVICSSDSLAQGMIVEAQSAGMNVPEDLAVVGFGNDPITGDMRPTITSVDIDGAQIAREVVKILNPKNPRRSGEERLIDVGFRIIARESA